MAKPVFTPEEFEQVTRALDQFIKGFLKLTREIVRPVLLSVRPFIIKYNKRNRRIRRITHHKKKSQAKNWRHWKKRRGA